MAVNPHNSPYFKPNNFKSNDIKLYHRWAAIKKFLISNHHVVEMKGQLVVDSKFWIAKHSSKMRMISQLDWVHYTPKTLAAAMDNNTVDVYYEQQLSDSRSDPNLWKRPDEESELKSHYAARAGRASLI